MSPSIHSKASSPALSVREAVDLPKGELLHRRVEDPTPDSPLTYVEAAYAVPASTTEIQAEGFLWATFHDVKSALGSCAPGKFVQLAVFDHSFETKPERPPLATLAWKDWRGEAVVRFPLTKKRVARPAGDASAKGLEPAGTIPPPASKPSTKPPRRADSSTAIAAVRKSVPPGRREPSDDLIGELFETIHELHFIPDIVSGCEFVLEVMKQTMPSEGMVVQVFDIDSQNFVVVRAQGPGYADAVMKTTPDSDRFVKKGMRNARAQKWDEAPPGHFRRDVWTALGVTPRTAVLAPVVQGGRYLGLLELANPVGGGAYHESEANALEYVCEQFAEFLANRPIVLDAETVTGAA